jgi:nucleoid-associated protein YgaU
MPSGRPRGFAALLGLVAFGAVVAWFGVVKLHRSGDAPSPPAAALPPREQTPPQAAAEQTANISAHTATPPSPEAPDTARDQVKAAAPASSGQTKPAPPAETANPPVPPADAAKPGGPSFDVVRVEPNGESVIAGRGAPGATVEMLRNGKSHARVIADTSGLFAFVPPPLQPGSHEIIFSAVAPDGARAQSRESVTVVINEDKTTKPLVTLTSPDRPTVVLSAPEPSTPKAATSEASEAPARTAAAPPPPAQPASQSPPASQPIAQASQPPSPGPRPGIKIATVEAEEGGRLFVSGRAAAGATVRLYLNENFIAPGGTGSDGKVSFAIGRGVQPGDYRVRLDDIDPVSGQVKSRAEVAFKFPAPLTVPLPPQVQPHLPAADLPATADARIPGIAAGKSASVAPQTVRQTAATPNSAGSKDAGGFLAGAGASRSMDPGVILVPEVNTAIVARGDNLWRISRRIYGQGTRYTVIYDANQGQIRNPDRIYPGQLFVLPPEKAVQTR